MTQFGRQTSLRSRCGSQICRVRQWVMCGNRLKGAELIVSRLARIVFAPRELPTDVVHRAVSQAMPVEAEFERRAVAAVTRKVRPRIPKSVIFACTTS